MRNEQRTYGSTTRMFFSVVLSAITSLVILKIDWIGSDLSTVLRWEIFAIISAYFLPFIVSPKLRKDLASPYVVFLGSYVLVSCAEAIRWIILGSAFHSPLGVTIVDYLPKALSLSLIGLLSFQFVYFFTKPSIDQESTDFKATELPLAKFFSYFGILLSVTILIILTIKYNVLATRRGEGQFIYGLPYMLYVGVRISFIPLFLSCLYFNYKTEGRMINMRIALAVVPYFILQALMSSRSNFFLPILGAILLRHFMKKEREKQLFVIIIMIALTLVVFTFMTAGRKAVVRTPGVQLETFFETLSSISLSKWLCSCFLISFSPATGALTQVIDFNEFFYGKTYLFSFLNLFLPSFILTPAERFPTPTLWFKQVFYPNVTNLGLDFSMLAEAYLNFGLLGIPIIMAISAYGLKRLYLLATFRKDFVSLILYVNVLIAFLWYLRSDSQPLFKQVFYTIIFIGLIQFFVKITARIRK